MNISSEQEMIKCGRVFADTLKPRENEAIVIELVGDVGAGKTTFVRGLAERLGIEEAVTSPSFTISKTYARPGGSLVHYDFYRLNEPGLMSEDLEEKIANPKNIIVLEWSESVQDILPENHIKITINYNDDGTREVNYENIS